ncbi:site-specific integrase [Streptomyces caniscabiei]|uniref:tyrosine-type recombinase/integrase n=1 Tax=Streptomyces caniscabiei TaxID=2746961 RepID=UPI001CE10D86|nr:site-specific integrase [Streptomyces caniscabiei]MDX3516150.1 site-specific integrase [Streptomyces caniscabiei]MDX3725224.1 site-specific integrase [Streptomyces caniscabiei]WEO21701.1 site-specific integrase [Streptomyces caniscabiei]
MEVFFTKRDLLQESCSGMDLVAVLDREPVREGMPFILGPDGSYDVQLNRFFRALPTLGCRSAESWKGYARDLALWGRFLAERRECSVWTAQRADFDAFYAARRLSQAPFRVTAKTWNRSSAALDKFYRWAVDEQLVASAPFGYREVAVAGQPTSRLVAEAKEKGAGGTAVKFLSLERYRIFRDVGLRGLISDGSDRPGRGVRCGARNASFSDLLVTTGVRLEEGGSLLEPELARLRPLPEERSARLDLAALTTKGDSGRSVWVPARVLRRARDYAEVERALTLARAAARGGWPERRWIEVSEPGPLGGRVRAATGQWISVRWADLSPDERMRLVEVDEGGTRLGPLVLWLSERGTPMTLNSWDYAFSRASERTAKARMPVKASPHTCRHTFAVHMLTQLVRAQIAVMRSGSADLRMGVYERVMGDPLRILQRLLGHRHISSTYIYLDSLAEAQELIGEAVAEMAGRLTEDSIDDLSALVGAW